MPAPFSVLPLSERPYFSRVSNFTTNAQNVLNYPLIAFTPGYALQAAELNEVQENFYIQQTLTQDLFKNWPLSTGNSDGTLKFPIWDGAVPLNPNQVTISGSTLTIGIGWYLIGGSNFFGGIKFWVYNTVLNLTTSLTVGNTIGLSISSEFIPCSFSEADEGYLFNDNSAGFYNQNSCGAHRYKIIINGLQTGSQVSYPICKVSTLGVCSYLNNLIIE